ncbi:MAG: GGDEF domain-containing phosphodiesterase [Pseudomonadales bacterium]|nr:GGDEF domain-containing phosphodiesterase [Pseudomonadales bacterium]
MQQFTQSFFVDGHELRTGASIGICLYPDDAGSVETLMVNADVAMCSAKEKAVWYQFFEERMNDAVGNQLGLENDLHKALDNDELYLTYQPKIELDTGKMVGAEVLLRWEHPVLGLASPVQFIPLAEESGVIIPIGHWVLKTACRKLAIWQEMGLSPINLAVNVSVKQFQSTDFTEQVKKVLEETSVDPKCLELEVTESLLMDAQSTAIETMTNFKEMGIRISIDDFGTGYSSLQYLRKFPIDYLKIDRSFVMGLDSGGKSIAIIRAIIAMAEGLGLEGISETFVMKLFSP